MLRPEVICHIMTSVDGRLLPSKWSKPYVGYDAQKIGYQYSYAGELNRTDAVMMGTATVKEFFPEHFDGCGCHKAFPDQIRTFVGDVSDDGLFVALVPEGDVRFTTNRFRGMCIVVVVSEQVSADYLEFLERMDISYVFAGKEGTDMTVALDALRHDFGIHRLSLQGGGIINGSMLQLHLVDELSIVVYPGVDGVKGEPSIIDYVGKEALPADSLSLELIDCKAMNEGCVWLRYKVHAD